MVTLQILVLPFLVRIRVPQRDFQCLFALMIWERIINFSVWGMV